MSVHIDCMKEIEDTQIKAMYESNKVKADQGASGLLTASHVISATYKIVGH